SILFLLLSLVGFNPLLIIVNAVAIWAVAGRDARYVFSSEYREIMRATPHIRYKTHPAVWALLIFLLLIIAGVISFALVSTAG
ncbi:MAG: hypothetical protein KDA37_03225, partial [Planctomycetales bacterium]|nr:hypothetical protein [Planctomycetales bacterium]